MEVWWIHKNNIFPCRDSTTPPATPPIRFFSPVNISSFLLPRQSHSASSQTTSWSSTGVPIHHSLFTSSCRAGHWTLDTGHPSSILHPSSIHPSSRWVSATILSFSFICGLSDFLGGILQVQQTDRQTGTQDRDTARHGHSERKQESLHEVTESGQWQNLRAVSVCVWWRPTGVWSFLRQIAVFWNRPEKVFFPAWWDRLLVLFVCLFPNLANNIRDEHEF